MRMGFSFHVKCSVQLNPNGIPAAWKETRHKKRIKNLFEVSTRFFTSNCPFTLQDNVMDHKNIAFWGIL